ncbi:MAG: hypothetical protein M3432_05380 [Chloroflexota bacterium]|nr:hypothetical protein [Chloroflexota bacterium]
MRLAAAFDLAEWRSVLLALLATRVGLLATGVVAMQVLPRGGSYLDLVPGLPWLSMWVQFDAKYYIDIAMAGYSYESDAYSSAAFFPLYPSVLRLCVSLLGRVDIESVAFFGFIVANLALLVALLYLVALVRLDLGAAVARRAVLYILILPTTVFLSAVYPESLFLATAVGSLYHARRGEWYRAGICGALGALARPFGILLVVPLAIELLRQRPPLRAAPALLLVPAGTAAFFGYLWWQLGDPWLYLRANQTWGRGFAWPWEVLLEFTRQPLLLFGWYHSIVDLAFVLAMSMLAVLAWRRLPASYAAFATVGLLFTLSTRVWISTPRHALALFPLVIMLAVYGERRWFHWAWLLLSAVLAVAFAARFASGEWVA